MATTTARKATTTTKASAKAKATTKAKATPKAKATRTTGPARTKLAKQVVTLRGKNQSWATIGEAIGMAPRSARRLFDEVKGEGAHHGLLPGKGGRQVAKPKAKRAAKKS